MTFLETTLYRALKNLLDNRRSAEAAIEAKKAIDEYESQREQEQNQTNY